MEISAKRSVLSSKHEMLSQGKTTGFSLVDPRTVR